MTPQWWRRTTTVALFVVVFGVVSAADTAQNCGNGITVSGLGGTFDGDYMANGFDGDGATDFTNLARDKMAAITLDDTLFCYSDADGCVFAIYDEGSLLDNNTFATVYARCKNCVGLHWPVGDFPNQQWETRVDGAWVAAPHVHAQCCTKAPNTCDSCSKEHCQKHTTFADCVLASETTDPCCSAWGWLNTGKCICANVDNQCDHASEVRANASHVLRTKGLLHT